MDQLLPAAPTVGEIARRHQVQKHQVEYVIQSQGIKPKARAGNARIFSEADVDRIGCELHRIASDRASDPAMQPQDGELEKTLQ